MDWKELTDFLDKQINYHEYWISVCQNTGSANATNLIFVEHQIRFNIFKEIREMIEPETKLSGVKN